MPQRTKKNPFRHIGFALVVCLKLPTSSLANQHSESPICAMGASPKCFKSHHHPSDWWVQALRAIIENFTKSEILPIRLSRSDRQIAWLQPLPLATTRRFWDKTHLMFQHLWLYFLQAPHFSGNSIKDCFRKIKTWKLIWLWAAGAVKPHRLIDFYLLRAGWRWIQAISSHVFIVNSRRVREDKRWDAPFALTSR